MLCDTAFFDKFEYTNFIGMIIFTLKGHLEVKNKMAVDGPIEFLTFDKIALVSYVIPQFWPILMH